MKRTFAFLLLLTSAIAQADEPTPDYCEDAAGWQEWQTLVQRNPKSDIWQRLYALRIGLCTSIRQGLIDADQAITLFENERDRGIRDMKKLERQADIEI